MAREEGEIEGKVLGKDSPKRQKRAAPRLQKSAHVKRPRVLKATLEREKDSLREMMNSFEKQNKKLTKENQTLRQRTDKLLRECLSLQAKGRGKPGLDDQKLRNELFDFRQQCRKWARENAPSVLPSNESESQFQSPLAGPIGEPSSALGPELVSDLRETTSSKYLLLTRALSWFVCKEIFEHPIAGSTEIWKIKSKWHEITECTRTQKYNLVHEWIGDMIEAFENDISKVDLSCLGATLNSSSSCKVCNLAIYFLQEFCQLPFPDQRLDWVQQLTRIMHQAAELSLRLWQQRTGLECLYHSQQLGDSGFERGSKFMALHDTVLMDPTDQALEGKEIRLIVEPAIITHVVDENGLITNNTKVWAEATVWMQDRERAIPRKSTLEKLDTVVSETQARSSERDQQHSDDQHEINPEDGAEKKRYAETERSLEDETGVKRELDSGIQWTTTGVKDVYDALNCQAQLDCSRSPQPLDGTSTVCIGGRDHDAVALGADSANRMILPDEVAPNDFAKPPSVVQNKDNSTHTDPHGSYNESDQIDDTAKDECPASSNDKVSLTVDNAG